MTTTRHDVINNHNTTLFDIGRSTPPVNITERSSYNVMSTRQTCVNLLTCIDSLLTLQCVGHGPFPPDLCTDITLTGYPLSLTALRIATMRKLSGIPVPFSSSSSSSSSVSNTTITTSFS